MKKSFFFLVIAAVLMSVSCKKEESTPAPGIYDNEILSLINQHRKTLGLSELTYNETIFQQALEHSTNMAKGTVDFGHDGFDVRIEKIQTALNGSGAAAENVAMGYTSAQAVVDGWLSSSGHKANIEGEYNMTGISAVKDSEGNYYYTQIFYKK